MEILLENASKSFLQNSYQQGLGSMYFTIMGCCRTYNITLPLHNPDQCNWIFFNKTPLHMKCNKAVYFKANIHPPKCLEHRQHQNRPLQIPSGSSQSKRIQKFARSINNRAEATLFHRSSFFFFLIKKERQNLNLNSAGQDFSLMNIN